MKTHFNNVAGINGYHVHIYYRPGTETKKTAAAMADFIAREFGSGIEERLHYTSPVGPHSAPNHALHISKDSFSAIVPWLQMNAQSLSILIHPVTGDEIRDHLECALWLGRPVDYNMAFFDAERARLARATPPQP